MPLEVRGATAAAHRCGRLDAQLTDDLLDRIDPSGTDVGAPDQSAYAPRALEHPGLRRRRSGSWWEPWAEWMLKRSGDEIPAPASVGSAAHPAGSYVIERR